MLAMFRAEHQYPRTRLDISTLYCAKKLDTHNFRIGAATTGQAAGFSATQINPWSTGEVMHINSTFVHLCLVDTPVKKASL